MASINYAAKEINVKIVYYGPGLSGKTTNLQVIHRKIPLEYKSDMVSLATETDRTLFFDFLPLDLGKIKGYSTKFQLYTVPGQVYYNATRKLVLRGVDGIVFVADSAADKLQENIESFQNMEENLAEYGYKRENIPTIIQYNKRDLSNALPIEELQRYINKYNLPWGEAIANKGIGVFDSLKLIGKLVIDYLNKKYSHGGGGGRVAVSPQYQQYSPSPTPPPRASATPPQMPEQSYYPQQGYPQPERRGPVPPVPPPPPSSQQYGGGFKQVGTPQVFPQAPGRSPFPPMQQPPMRGGGNPQESYGVPPHPQQQQYMQPSYYGESVPQEQEERERGEEHPTFEPPTAYNKQRTPLAENQYYNYGSIDLPPENVEIEGRGLSQNPPSYDVFEQSPGPEYGTSEKSDLDLEIERYQREIEEKQKRTRAQQTQKGGGAIDTRSISPQKSGSQLAQPQDDYDVYNMEVPSMGPQAKQPIPPVNKDEDEMYFTSVDTQHIKKPPKRPVNPRTQQQQKGFLSKFFNKDMT